MNINEVLKERGKNYGDFSDFAEVVSNLTDVVEKTSAWDKLDSVHKEGLRMIIHKLARILNGDPNYEDSWVDLSGYATLVANHCNKRNVALKAISEWKPLPENKPSDEELDMEIEDFINASLIDS